MSKKTEQPTQELFVTRVIVESFPSRVELYQKLDKFISDNNYPKDFSADNKDNIVQFIFKNPDHAFEFVKYLNIEKIKNPIYAKLKTNILVDTKREAYYKKGLVSPRIKDFNLSSPVREVLNTSENKAKSNKEVKPKYLEKVNIK